MKIKYKEFRRDNTENERRIREWLEIFRIAEKYHS